MEIKQNIDIHNRFDIEVTDAKTGEVKQRAVAHNILLDSIYTRLCGGSSYFANIHFGTGTGVPVPTRTSLFTHLGTKTAVDEEIVKAIPLSSWKRKIVLNPEEYVGQTLTEVGIAYGSTASYLMTHAMLKDSEGNPVSILKTDTDVVTIYATVFVTFDTSISTLNYMNVGINTNTLINYLVGGGSAPIGSFGLNEIPNSFARLGSTANAVWTSDVANRKRKTNVARFGTTVANGDAKALEFTNLFNLSFPAAGIHPGQSYTDVPIGTGDGVETDFLLPSDNINTLAMRIDGVATTAFTTNNLQLSLIDKIQPPNMPARGSSVALNADGGTVLAVGTYNISPYVKIYDWDLTEWIERATPPNMPANGYSVALSSDGTVLAVATYVTSPYIKIYDWDLTEWIERATLPNMPAKGQAVALNADGTVLAVGTGTTLPYVKIYDWDLTEWIERATHPNMPANGYSVALSSDGTVLAVGASDISPYIKIYDWNLTEWIERATPPNMPARGYSVALNADGTVLAVGTGTTLPYVKIYDWDLTEWIERATPPNMPTFGLSVALNADGTVLAVGVSDTSPYIKIYDWNLTEWIERATLPNMPARGYSVALNADGTVLAVGTGTTLPYVKYYTSKESTQSKITFNTAPALSDVITADYTVDGVHKTDQYVIDASFAIQFGEGV